MEGEVRRQGMGNSRKVRRQPDVTIVHIQSHPDEASFAAAHPSHSKPRSWTISLDAVGACVEIPAAVLVVAETVILFAGVVARYLFQYTLTWSDEFASILFP
jgi:hypothetical protein